MDERIDKNHNTEEIVDPAKLVKKVRKSRKLRKGRRKQSVLRRSFRFIMTVLMLFLFIYVSKMPQWYLPKNAYTKNSGSRIFIENNRIVPSHRILGLLKIHKVPDKPIYMMKTQPLEDDIKKLTPIKDVYIRRYAFPARLHIIIKERVPVLSVILEEKGPVVGAFAEDGVFMGHEYMPLNPKLKTVKVVAKYGGDNSYTRWTLANINEIQKIANYIETYSNEKIEYIDMRNPNDVYVKLKTVKIRLGKLDASLYERMQRVASILPRIKLIDTNIDYLDISWEKVNYLKLK